MNKLALAFDALEKNASQLARKHKYQRKKESIFLLLDCLEYPENYTQMDLDKEIDMLYQEFIELQESVYHYIGLLACNEQITIQQAKTVKDYLDIIFELLP